MIRNLIIISLLSTLFQSCGFLFYNYRASYESNFIIPKKNSDANLSYKTGQMIYRQSYISKPYSRYKSPTYDTLNFYGPDYHTLKFIITESKDTTNIHFTFFAFHGSRSRPPNKKFIESFRDSLKNKFGASEIIVKNISNEKKRKKDN
jgi:hypothetical protein